MRIFPKTLSTSRREAGRRDANSLLNWIPTFLVVFLLPSVLLAESLTLQYGTKTNLTTPNAIAVADIVHTPDPEIIITDVRGALRVYSASTGEEIRSMRFNHPDQLALTAPAVGDFTGDNTLDIAVGTQDGEIIVFRGTNLEIVAREYVGTDFSLQPTVVTLPPDDEGIVRDRLIIYDGGSEGNIHAVDVTPQGTLSVVWTYPSRSRLNAPIGLGKVRSPNRIDLVGGTADGFVLLLDPFQYDPVAGTHDKVLVTQGAQIPHTPLTWMMEGSERESIVVTLANGEMIALSYNRIPRPSLERIWSIPTRAQPMSAPVLLDDGRGTRYILQATNANAVFVESESGNVAVRTSDIDGPNTAFALLPNGRNFPLLAYGIGRTIQMTEPYDSWLRSEGHGSLRLKGSELRHNLAFTPVFITHGENRRVLLIGCALDDGFLYAFDTGLALPEESWPTRTPWMTSGGSPYIGQGMAREWANLENNRRRVLRSEVARWESELESAIDQSDWDRAAELAQRLVDFDPLEKRYSSLRFSVTFKRHFLAIITVTLLTVALVGFITWKLVLFMTYRRLRLRAEGATSRGDHDEARRLYYLLHGKTPKDTRVATALARVLITLKEYSPEYRKVLSQAWNANRGDKAILHAFTRALLAAGPETGDEALTVYNEALASEFPEPQLVEYGVGRCMMARGDHEEAGKRLRSALRGGLTTNNLYSALCDVYLETDNTTAKALPVFQQQHQYRREDPNFLKAYLASCMDAKKADNEVEGLCHEVLEFDSSHIPAYLQLAMIGMQKNQIGPAIDEIRNALAVDGNNARAISLLAYCFLMQGRKDEEALHAYKRALVDSPNEKEILRMVSQIYFERGVYNEESISIYHRCLEENPGDIPTLKALAQTARLTSDHNLAVRSIEALAESGQIDKSLVLQLANAYVKLNIIEPRVEKTLRGALQIEPENPEFVALYTRALIAQDRTDIDSIRVYEKHLTNTPGDIPAGRQLAKSFISANRYEHALTTTKRFLALSPEDEELQRLNALASLYDNKIDEAVSEYKRILERNPEDKEALVNLALAYGQKMRTDDEAQKLFAKAVAIQPENDLLHLAMARVQVANNNAAGAVEAYKEALRVREDNEQNVLAHITALLADAPETLRVRWFQVELLVSYGHFREALDQLEYINQNHPGQGANILRVLEVILQKDGNNTRALLMAGMHLLAEDKVDLAVKRIEKAYQLQPAAQEAVESVVRVYQAALEKKDDPDIRLRLGKVYYNEQEYDDAIGCFQKTAQDYRFEAESTKMLGKCFTGKGMLDIALQEYRKLVVDEETKELLYELAQRYEQKKDLVGAKTVYRQLFAADIGYKDVKTRFEMLSGSTSDPMSFEKTNIVQQMSEAAARRYELLDELGRGAMGIVYRARDKELEEIVALKILPDNMSNNPEAVRRFKIEARNARKLSHPNIVRIHDIGEEMGRKYISMEYVDGSDLKKKFKSAPEGKLPLKEVLKYMMDIADALGYAHRLGIVHRDIKPANIMLTSQDEVKVTDFGIAKLMDSAGGGMGAAEGTMIGAVIGTPLYMSPEQVQGIPVDNRADLYSYGIMFYEMLSGRPPFTQGDLAYQHLHKEPEPIEGIPVELWTVVSKCLAKEKEQRWENAELIYDSIRDIYKTL